MGLDECPERPNWAESSPLVQRPSVSAVPKPLNLPVPAKPAGVLQVSTSLYEDLTNDVHC